MVEIVNEAIAPLEFLLSEAPGFRSREKDVLKTPQNLEAGTVVALLDAGKYEILDPAEDDGAEVAAGILAYATDATDADVEATFIVRDAEVAADRLVWPEGITELQKTAAIAQLADVGIILRT